jgi:hypothetical protein
MPQVNKITTTGTGQAADFIRVGPGDHVIEFTWAGSAGDADLQNRISSDSGTFRDTYDSAGVVNITANKSVRVSGNQDYNVDVTTHTSALTVTATACE